MGVFRDKNDKEWTITVNISTMKRVRDLLDVNLMDMVGGDLAQRLAGDPVLLVDVIYGCVKPQADAAGISDEQFGDSLNGDSIDDASRVLLDSLINFSPKARGTVLRKAADKMKILQAEVLERTSKSLDAITSESLAGNLSGSLPESSDSTPES